MDAHIEELLKKMPDSRAPSIVHNILDKDLPPPKEELLCEFDNLLQQKQLEPEKYYSLFVGGAHLRFPSGDATLQMQNISPETYKGIRDLGETGVIEPQPVVRRPDISDAGSV